jgi:hypothetical protein
VPRLPFKLQFQHRRSAACCPSRMTLAHTSSRSFVALPGAACAPLPSSSLHDASALRRLNDPAHTSAGSNSQCTARLSSPSALRSFKFTSAQRRSPQACCPSTDPASLRAPHSVHCQIASASATLQFTHLQNKSVFIRRPTIK